MKMMKWASEQVRKNVNVVILLLLLRFGNRGEGTVIVEDTVRVKGRVGVATGKLCHHFAN